MAKDIKNPELLEIWNKINGFSYSEHGLSNPFKIFQNQDIHLVFNSLNLGIGEHLNISASNLLVLLLDLARTNDKILRFRLQSAALIVTIMISLPTYFGIAFISISWLSLPWIFVLGFFVNLSILIITSLIVLFNCFFYIKNLLVIHYLEVVVTIRKFEEIKKGKSKGNKGEEEEEGGLLEEMF